MNFFNKYYYGDYDSLSQTPSSGEDLVNAQPLLKQDNKKNYDTLQSEVSAQVASPTAGGREGAEWPLWEIFIRSKQGLDHKHVGSLHAADAHMAIENARDVYTRRQEGVSIWVVESKFIHASNPDDAESFYEPANDKVYRHPTFYDLPDELTHM
jgi:ring-1,2-phenylacetyl-CoA epoxidase subunit PaaB